ncbi:unnamed protein product [Amoebophrya sp. A120]|nr:unnamed protein product [Amoebophrya sp. A120]|eukprot:GSA120T00006225001.1
MSTEAVVPAPAAEILPEEAEGAVVPETAAPVELPVEEPLAAVEPVEEEAAYVQPAAMEETVLQPLLRNPVLQPLPMPTSFGLQMPTIGFQQYQFQTQAGPFLQGSESLGVLPAGGNGFQFFPDPKEAQVGIREPTSPLNYSLTVTTRDAGLTRKKKLERKWCSCFWGLG